MHDLTDDAFPDDEPLSLTLDALRGDVAQLEGVLGDAVSRLTRSFETIDALTIVNGRAPGFAAVAASPADRRRRAVAATIETSVAEAVTALQFHDIASQILRKLETRIDAVERLVVTAPPPGPVLPARGFERPGVAWSRVQVAQTSLAVGTAELF